MKKNISVVVIIFFTNALLCQSVNCDTITLCRYNSGGGVNCHCFFIIKDTIVSSVNELVIQSGDFCIGASVYSISKKMSSAEKDSLDLYCNEISKLKKSKKVAFGLGYDAWNYNFYFSDNEMVSFIDLRYIKFNESNDIKRQFVKYIYKIAPDNFGLYPSPDKSLHDWIKENNLYSVPPDSASMSK